MFVVDGRFVCLFLWVLECENEAVNNVGGLDG